MKTDPHTPAATDTAPTLKRRKFMAYFSTLGLAATAFPKALFARMQERKKISTKIIAEAEKIAGLEFTEAERELMAKGVNKLVEQYEKLRAYELDNSVPPAFSFSPVLSGMKLGDRKSSFKLSEAVVPELPSNLEGLAYQPVTVLSQLIQSRRVSSMELTQMYLERLQRYGAKLECVITLTEEMAMQQAKSADEEIRCGKDRGPLHGIPWGAKDLLATRNYKTTWGAMPFKDQMIDEDATVVQRLEQAGAVLVAKLTMGALAWGDVWFGGKTKNPWNLEQGSSGSSAGPAAATAAGLVGFAIGTETYGSIVSPSARCGVTGLRPTFGRVSRHGAMALSWTLDKIGPMCRSVEDCAIVFNAIIGPDGKDGTVVDQPFNWNPDIKLENLRIGFVKDDFEKERDDKPFDDATLDKLRALGAKLVRIKLPDYPSDDLMLILEAEAATAFDELTRTNRDDLLVRQIEKAWPNVFRTARLIPAVEYIRANRLRTRMMQEFATMMEPIDLYVSPSFGGKTLPMTNLTGHPAVVLPNGFREDGTPASITFVGKLYEEGRLLATARAYQNATGFHLRHPELEG